jgi:tetratricopeptide (TPR) repeat protein
VRNPIELALEEARQQRAKGRPDEAERAYVRAAELAQSSGNELLLGHALRHMSDLSREKGAVAEAWEHASKAVALYRRSGEQLALANAIRLQALSACDPGQAASCWREARELYSSLGVAAGVRECDSKLDG